MGETARPHDAVPFATLSDGATDGVRMGTAYRHVSAWRAWRCSEVLSELLGRAIAAPTPKRRNYELLGEWFDRHQRGFEEMYL